MTSDESKKVLLQECLSKAQNLVELVEYATDSIVSKTILDKLAGTITLFAFDKGQRLTEHTTPYDAVMQILDGRASLRIGLEEKEVLPGQIIIMPGKVPHAVCAKDKFKMLLTMIRA